MNNNSIYQALAQITQVGLTILVPILALILFGSWLDKKIGTGGWALIICAIMGVGIGIVNIIKLGKKI